MARPFATIEEAIEDVRQGKMVIVCDDEERENEGDLMTAAELVTAEAVNFMVKEARGLVCVALTPERCDDLGLRPMAVANESAFETAFTVSIEARTGVTTGISAADRARTIRVASDPAAGPSELVRPGHIFPLRARPGGVLERVGHTEAAVDLARLAGLTPAGVICEIMNDDGTMARVTELMRYGERHRLKLVTVADLIAYRRRTERLVARVVDTRLPTSVGDFVAVGYRSCVGDKHHVALVKGDVASADGVLVRIHGECVTGDVFHSLRCDCGERLDSALARIQGEDRGVLVYLSRDRRGSGLFDRPRGTGEEDGANRRLASSLDSSDDAVAAQILRDLGVASVRLLNDEPERILGLARHGLSVAAEMPAGGTSPAGRWLGPGAVCAG